MGICSMENGKIFPNHQAVYQHALDLWNAWISLIFHCYCDSNCNHCRHASDFSSIYISVIFNDRLVYAVITLFRKNLIPLWTRSIFFSLRSSSAFPRRNPCPMPAVCFNFLLSRDPENQTSVKFPMASSCQWKEKISCFDGVSRCF